MASSTAGRLYGDFTVDKLRVTAAPISGAGVNRAINANWLRALGPTPPTGGGGRVLVFGGHSIVNGFSGPYNLAGHTVLAGVPFSAQVLVYPETAPSVLVRSTITDATGVFSFSGLAAGRYTVLGIDITDVYNGVVYCLVVAIP
jgi:hypothetical protein